MQDRYALSKYRIEKSEEDLKTSDYLLKQKFFAQSLNRSYYAIFHATRALFALDGFNAKTHNGLLAVFNKEYIHKQILPSEYYTIIKSAEE